MSDSSSEFRNFFCVRAGNLDYSTTSADLLRFFTGYGRIEDAYIATHPVTKLSRGFGYVKYYNKHDAVEAILKLNHMPLKGRQVHLTAVGHRMKQCLGRRIRRSSSTSSSASSCGRREVVSVKISNLHYTVDERVVRQHFQHCGRIADVYVPRYYKSRVNKGYGFVRFYRRSDALYAIEHMDLKSIRGRYVRVAMARYGKPPVDHPPGQPNKRRR